MKNRLSIHAIVVSGASAGGQLVMLVVFAALGREVGPERLGVVTVSLGLAVVLSGLVDFGANNLWVRDVASGVMTPEQYGCRATTKILVGAAMGTAIALICLSHHLLRPYWGTGVVLFSWILAQTLHVSLRADSKNTGLALSLVSERSILLILYLTLSARVSPEVAFFTCYLLGAVVGGGIALVLMDSDKRPFRRLTSLGETWRGSRYFGIGSIMINMSSMDSAIAGAVGGNVIVGLYGAVNRWTQPIMLASNTFTTLLVPVAAREPTFGHVWRRIRSTIWLPAAGTLLCLAMSLAAQPLVLLIMGAQYADSVPVLQILSLAVALININQPLAGLLQARGHDRFVAGLLAVAVVTRLAILIPLVQHYGARGIALAFVVGEALLLIGLLLYTRSLRRSNAR